MATVGMIGQARTGAGMTERLRAAGIEVVAFDRDPSRTDVAHLGAMRALASLRPEFGGHEATS